MPGKPTTAAKLVRQLRAEGVTFDLACGYGCHDWTYDLDTNLKTCIGRCGGVYQMTPGDRLYAEALLLWKGNADA